MIIMKTKLFLAAVALPLFFSCTGSKSEPREKEEEMSRPEGMVVLNRTQQEAIGMKLGSFSMRNLTTVVKTNGQLEVPPSGRAEVNAVIGGNVKEIRVFEGDRVEKGQVLAVLEHPDYITLQENFAEAANQLDFLEKDYDRQKELFENNVGAGKDFQKVSSEYNTAKAKYEGLKSRLGLLHISPEAVKKGNITNTISVMSPISGYVSEVVTRIGKYAGATDGLFEITDNSAIHADFMVYENDVALVRKGQKVHFAISNDNGEEWLATIFAIGKEFESNARAVHVHAKLDRNPGNLIPGMYISGHIHTDDHYTRTLPNDAIVREGTKSYMFILDHSGDEEASGEGSDHDRKDYFRMVEVITGREDGGYTEVRLPKPVSGEPKIVLNAAYYLLSDLKKEETGEE